MFWSNSGSPKIVRINYDGSSRSVIITKQILPLTLPVSLSVCLSVCIYVCLSVCPTPGLREPITTGHAARPSSLHSWLGLMLTRLKPPVSLFVDLSTRLICLSVCLSFPCQNLLRFEDASFSIIFSTRLTLPNVYALYAVRDSAYGFVYMCVVCLFNNKDERVNFDGSSCSSIITTKFTNLKALVFETTMLDFYKNKAVQVMTWKIRFPVIYIWS